VVRSSDKTIVIWCKYYYAIKDLVAVQRSLNNKMSDLYLKQLLLNFYLLASIQV
jgi:hypothetical protein